ncbi:putative reverse transcriptase domain-containing protein [Tanacetum coccineum]
MDVAAGIDIPNSMLMLDAVECLEQVEEGLQDIYEHVIKIPLQWIENSKTGQRELEARSLIVGGERASLLEQVASLERSNARLRGTMMMERARADSGFGDTLIVEPVNMTVTSSGMTLEAIEELVIWRVEEALTAYEVTRTANALEAESQSQNGNENDNRNGGDGNDGDGNGGNGNPNENNRGGLRKYGGNQYSIFSNCPEKYQVKYATCTLLNSALTWWNSHKRTIGADAAFSMSWRELMKLITEIPRAYHVVHQDGSRRGEPTRLQDAVRIANNLMDQKLKGYAMKNAENKRKFDNSQKDNRRQQPPNKRQNVGGQNVVRAYTTCNNERRVYNGPLPLCNKCKFHHEGPCTVRCGKCKKVGHLTRDCKVADSTTSNQRGQVVN